MLDKKEFADIRKELSKHEQDRELMIQTSREIILLSKSIIYAIHRGDMKKAGELSNKIESSVKGLPCEDCGTGMKRVAMQEYTEALALFSFVKSKKIQTRKQLGVDTEGYLGGLADLTGELVRMAVNRAIKKEFDAVFEIKEIVVNIYGEFLQIDFRNSELRKKSDQIKWNLQKLEDMAYNLSSKNGR